MDKQFLGINNKINVYSTPFFVWLTQSVVGCLTIYFFHLFISPGRYNVKASWWENLGAWDGSWYMEIARQGYTSVQSTAFFPIYPMLIKFLNVTFSLPMLVSGLIISNLCFYFGLHFFYRLTVERFDRATAQKATYLLAAFPAALFYQMVYTESVTLLTTVLFFYFLQKHKWYSAMISGFIATGVHDLGAILIFPALIYWWQQRKDYSNLKQVIRFFSIGLIVFSLILHMLYLYMKFGNPLAFVEAQTFWDREPVVPVLSVLYVMLKVGYKLVFMPNPDLNYCFIMIVNALCTLLFFVIGILMIKNKNLTNGMKLFFWITFVLSIVSGTGGDLQSYARFMAVIFPGFMLMASLKLKNVWFSVIFIVMVLLKLVLTGMFTNGYWVT